MFSERGHIQQWTIRPQWCLSLASMVTLYSLVNAVCIYKGSLRKNGQIPEAWWKHSGIHIIDLNTFCYAVDTEKSDSRMRRMPRLSRSERGRKNNTEMAFTDVTQPAVHSSSSQHLHLNMHHSASYLLLRCVLKDLLARYYEHDNIPVKIGNFFS